MRYKFQSEIPKKGNPADHEEAVENVIKFLRENSKGDWTYWYGNGSEWLELFHWKFNKQEGLRSDYKHSFDISLFNASDNLNPFLFIEVDGAKHDKLHQKANDQTVNRYVTEVLKKDIIRLDKVECNGKETDRNMYFRQKLRKYIK